MKMKKAAAALTAFAAALNVGCSVYGPPYEERSGGTWETHFTEQPEETSETSETEGSKEQSHE